MAVGEQSFPVFDLDGLQEKKIDTDIDVSSTSDDEWEDCVYDTTNKDPYSDDETSDLSDGDSSSSDDPDTAFIFWTQNNYTLDQVKNEIHLWFHNKDIGRFAIQRFQDWLNNTCQNTQQTNTTILAL